MKQALRGGVSGLPDASEGRKRPHSALWSTTMRPRRPQTIVQAPTGLVRLPHIGPVAERVTLALTSNGSASAGRVVDCCFNGRPPS